MSNEQQYAHLEVTGTLFRDAQVRVSSHNTKYLSAIVDVAKHAKDGNVFHQKYKLLVFDFDVLSKVEETGIGAGSLIRAFGEHRPDKPSPCGKYSNSSVVATQLEVINLILPSSEPMSQSTGAAIGNEIPF